MTTCQNERNVAVRSSDTHFLGRVRRHIHLLCDITSIYGVQIANYVIPLLTVPYLSRVMGAPAWGLMAMAQAFAVCGGLIIEYGFVYSATRQIATASTKREIEEIIAGVLGARVLLIAFVIAVACCAWFFVSMFHQHAFLLWAAVTAEIFKSSLPTYFFYGIKRVAIASALDVSARLASGAGMFVFVRGPEDAWKVLGLQAGGAIAALVIGYAVIYSRYAPRWPRLRHGLRILREGANMFLFRGAHHIYVLGNAFLLGLFASPEAVGYYAGAEKINSAAVGLLSPLSTALYPRAAGLVKNSFGKAAVLTKVSLYAMLAVSILLGLLMWFGCSWIVRLFLGPNFLLSASALRILSLRAPAVALTNVLGFQWLLALGMEKSFQWITIASVLLNVLLAVLFAPTYTFNGMAWCVVTSQTVAAAGIWLVLRHQKLNPLAMTSRPSYA